MLSARDRRYNYKSHLRGLTDEEFGVLFNEYNFTGLYEVCEKLKDISDQIMGGVCTHMMEAHLLMFTTINAHILYLQNKKNKSILEYKRLVSYQRLISSILYWNSYIIPNELNGKMIDCVLEVIPILQRLNTLHEVECKLGIPREKLIRGAHQIRQQIMLKGNKLILDSKTIKSIKESRRLVIYMQKKADYVNKCLTYLIKKGLASNMDLINISWDYVIEMAHSTHYKDIGRECTNCRDFKFERYYDYGDVYVVPDTEHDCCDRYENDENFGRCCHRKYATVIPNILRYTDPDDKSEYILWCADTERCDSKFTIKYKGKCLCKAEVRIN